MAPPSEVALRMFSAVLCEPFPYLYCICDCMFPLESTLRTVAGPLQFPPSHSAPTTKLPLLAWLMLSATVALYAMAKGEPVEGGGVGLGVGVGVGVAGGVGVGV